MTTAPTQPTDPSQTENQPTALRTHLCGILGTADVGQTVTVCGWVARRREHGEHLAFVDLRDHTGIIQCVIDHATDVRSEWVIAVSGTVRHRPEGTVNPSIGTGEVEIGDCTVEVLNEAEPPPFSVDDRDESDEPVRLKHRYVDLRRPRMQRNLRLRARVNAALRAAMDRQGFAEIETPLLWAPTPEGSREFSVPSRLHHGEFYALRRARSSPSSSSWWAASTVTSRSPAAFGTRTSGPTASSSSCSSIWSAPSPPRTTSWPMSPKPCWTPRRRRRGSARRRSSG